MLSIVIPSFNYNVLPLVQELYNQCHQANIAFEIMVLDDASSNDELIFENTKINEFPNCHYEVLEQNIGRSAIRNLLAKQAKYNWLLFLDADTMPAHKNFISVYLPHLNNEEKVVYGGIRYQEQRPDNIMLLRWIYGNSREAVPARSRNMLPHKSLLTLNFAVKKSVFDTVKFNESIPNLRHEDTLFSYDLKLAGIKVEHIENEAYHHGLESSEIFLKKTEESVVGLKNLLDQKLLATNYIKIGSTYAKLKSLRLAPIAASAFKLCKGIFRKNLLSSKPSLFIFDLYRLGYICSLK